MSYWTNVCSSGLNLIYSILDLESGYISPLKTLGGKKSVTQKQSCVQKYGPCRRLNFFQEDFDNGCVYVCEWKCYCGTYGLGGWFFFSVLNETNLASLTFISFAEVVKIILKGQCVFWYLQPLSTGIRRPLFFIQRQLKIVINLSK